MRATGPERPKKWEASATASSASSELIGGLAEPFGLRMALFVVVVACLLIAALGFRVRATAERGDEGLE